MRAVNLIPSEQRSGGAIASRSGGAAYFVLGLLGGLVVLAMLYGLSHHEVESRRAEAASLTTRAQEVQAQAARLSPYTSFVALREQRLQAITQLVASRFDWSSAMGELSRVLPSDVSLTSMQGTVGTSSTTAGASKTAATAASGVSSATPPGATPTFTLAGCATSQTVVAQMLVRLRLVNGVNAVSLQSSTKSGSSGGGNCPGNSPVFSVQVSFDPLPTPAATSGAASSAAAPAAASGGSPAAAGSSASAASTGAER